MSIGKNHDEHGRAGHINDRLLLGLLLALLAAGLFLPSALGDGSLVLPVKIVILVAGVAVILTLWGYAVAEEEEAETDYARPAAHSAMEMLSSEGGDAALDPAASRFDFQRELSQFFINLVKIVRSSLVANSAVVFLWNQRSNALQVEFCDSQNQGIGRGDQIGLNGTLPGSVLINKTAILEQNIPPGHGPVNYYEKPVEIRSFLGVPMNIHGEVRGVLIVDSLVANDFSENDLNLLYAYEKLISQGIEMLSEREKSRLVSQSIAAQKAFLTALSEKFTLDNVQSALIAASRMVFEFDRMTISYVDEQDHSRGVVAAIDGQEDGMGAGFRFPLEDGLNGWVVRRAKPLLLDDLEKGELFRPRYSRDDKSNFGLRSFVGVPIAFDGRVLGLITLENRQANYYTEWDQNILSVLADNAGLALKSLRGEVLHEISE